MKVITVMELKSKGVFFYDQYLYRIDAGWWRKIQLSGIIYNNKNPDLNFGNNLLLKNLALNLFWVEKTVKLWKLDIRSRNQKV